MNNKQKNLKKYCIIATQRSGSTWLINLLDSHPAIKSFDELFLGWPAKKRPEPNYLRFCEYCQTHSGIRPGILFKYLDDFLGNYPGDHQIIGFKIMYNQLLYYPEILLKLVYDRYKIIHLMRENYLDLVISKSNLYKHRLAHSNKSVSLDPLYIDPASLSKKIKSIDTKVQLAQQLIQLLPLPKKTIIYENLHKNCDLTLQNISKFLDIKTSDILFKSQQKKINTGTYRDKIANYDEVVTVLRGTRFEHFLKEE